MLYCRVIHITIVLHVLMRGFCTIQANLCLIIIVRVECLSMKFISSWGCTAIQDQTYETKMYILDVIISVGYMVKSII